MIIAGILVELRRQFDVKEVLDNLAHVLEVFRRAQTVVRVGIALEFTQCADKLLQAQEFRHVFNGLEFPAVFFSIFRPALGFKNLFRFLEQFDIKRLEDDLVIGQSHRPPKIRMQITEPRRRNEGVGQVPEIGHPPE